VVRSPRNVGFAAGCNLGARRGSAPAILFVNPDTRLLPDTIPPLARGLAAHGPRALLGARHFLDDETTLALAPLRGAPLLDEAVHALWGRGWLPKQPLRLLARRARLWRARGPQPVRAVSGGALLMGRAAFDELGGFDERYFLYVEDIDLCKRARARGMPVLYVPEARVVHYGDQSSQQDPGAAGAAAAASRATYLSLHHGRAARALARLAVRAAAWLPDRQRRWQEAAPITTDFEFRCPGDRPWVVELARSPLFDDCLTAFPEARTYRAPAGLWPRLRAGTYYARIAEEVRPDRWIERALYAIAHARESG